MFIHYADINKKTMKTLMKHDLYILFVYMREYIH